jgi:hypothetical protein
MSEPTDVSRRAFLALAGGAAAGAVLAVSCSSKSKPATGASTTTTAAASTTTSTTAGSTTTSERVGTDADLSILRTLTSVELTLVTAYNALAGYDVLQTDALAAARLFRDHHLHHATSLQDLTVKAGGSPISDPNGYLMSHELKPSLEQLRGKPSQSAVRFAARLERMLAATYATSAGTLSRPELRQAVMVSGAVEARHATVWATQLSSDATGWAVDAVIPVFGHPGEGDGAIDADAYLSAS